MSQLRHPNILGYEDAWQSRDVQNVLCGNARMFLSVCLRETAERGGKGGGGEEVISRELYPRWLFQIISALEYLHEQNNEDQPMLHRAVQPDNILVTDTCVLKLCAFHTSKRLKAKRDKTGTVIGGGGLFHSPECRKGKSYDLSVDIWSFGVTAVYIAGYTRASKAVTADRLVDIMEGSGQDAQTVKVVRCAMAQDPHHRPTAPQIAKHLADHYGSSWLHAPPPPHAFPSALVHEKQPSSRHRDTAGGNSNLNPPAELSGRSILKEWDILSPKERQLLARVAQNNNTNSETSSPDSPPSAPPPFHHDHHHQPFSKTQHPQPRANQRGQLASTTPAGLFNLPGLEKYYDPPYDDPEEDASANIHETNPNRRAAKQGRPATPKYVNQVDYNPERRDDEGYPVAPERRGGPSSKNQGKPSASWNDGPLSRNVPADQSSKRRNRSVGQRPLSNSQPGPDDWEEEEEEEDEDLIDYVPPPSREVAPFPVLVTDSESDVSDDDDDGEDGGCVPGSTATLRRLEGDLGPEALRLIGKTLSAYRHRKEDGAKPKRKHIQQGQRGDHDTGQGQGVARKGDRSEGHRGRRGRGQGDRGHRERCGFSNQSGAVYDEPDSRGAESVHRRTASRDRADAQDPRRRMARRPSLQLGQHHRPHTPASRADRALPRPRHHYNEVPGETDGTSGLGDSCHSQELTDY